MSFCENCTGPYPPPLLLVAAVDPPCESSFSEKIIFRSTATRAEGLGSRTSVSIALDMLLELPTKKFKMVAEAEWCNELKSAARLEGKASRWEIGASSIARVR